MWLVCAHRISLEAGRGTHFARKATVCEGQTPRCANGLSMGSVRGVRLAAHALAACVAHGRPGIGLLGPLGPKRAKLASSRRAGIDHPLWLELSSWCPLASCVLVCRLLCAVPVPACRSDGVLVAAPIGRASGRARSRPHPLVLGAMAAPKRSRCGEAVVWAFVALVSSCCVPALGWPRLLARPCASSARRRVPPSSCRGPEPRAAAAARCVVCAVVPFAGPVWGPLSPMVGGPLVSLRPRAGCWRFPRVQHCSQHCLAPD